MNILFKLLIVIILIPACNNKEEKQNLSYLASSSFTANKESVESNDAHLSKSSPSLSSSPSKIIPERDKKIIRNASLRFQVKDMKESSIGIETIIKKFDAYIANSNEQNSNYSIRTTMVVRVKSNRFDELVKALLNGAIYVDQKSITAEDVTTQFIDAEARLNTKRELEKRYTELLNKAKSVEEILQIENQLSIIREEIEAKEGILKYLSDQVNYSTINLEIYESIKGEIQPQDGFFSKVGQGIQKGWNLLLDSIVGIFYIWPFVILLLVVIYFIRKWRRRKKAKA